MTLFEIAALAGASVPPGTPAPETPITRGASLELAGPGDIVFFEHPKYLRALRATKAEVALVPEDFAEELPLILLRVAKPSLAFTKILQQLTPAPVPYESGIHQTAVVAADAHIDSTASIQPHAVIESGVTIGPRTVIGAHAFVGRGTTIGADCLIHPSVVLREHSVLGARIVIHSCAVIGSDGFGFQLVDGRHAKVPQIGHVQIDDDVEIGAGTTIDRARFGRTWIQEGTKIDNLVQIAHNVVIGPHCLIIAQTGISGSARLGRYVTLAGQVGVVGHVEVGDEVVVAAKSGVSKDTPAKQVLMGMFGVPMKEARELVAHYHRLPKTAERIKTLEAEVRELRTLLQTVLSQSAPSSEPVKIALAR
jgi:UDP-3-O-[3-hydroxymyristoyl] glucosamine N-acyltransferase